MLLVAAEVGPFRSIDKPQTVEIDPDVTVLVGMNEAGKTVFLQALEKSDDAVGLATFNPIEDYPRKDLSAYLKQHKEKPARATRLTYRLTDDEVDALNTKFLTSVPKGFTFSVSQSYDNGRTVGLEIDEAPVVAALSADPNLSADAKSALATVTSVRAIPKALVGVALTDKDKAWVAAVQARVDRTKWDLVIQSEAWEWIGQRLPKFAFFGEYELLPSKMNLTDLASRVAQAEAWKAQNPNRPQKDAPKHLEAKHLGVLALLRMADISIGEFANSGGYETLKARIEAVSISLTDQILEFWKQNENLEVEVDIKPDPNDSPPFNSGPNLYLRIKNRRHRGVSTPFLQRSRGFVWFFSFLVWFDSVKHQLEGSGVLKERDLVLLLDEPGLNLHALAQADFLRYIDRLAEDHQVVYSTHSPFMVNSGRLHRVRVVEDREKVGTTISSNISASDERTIFPLQAALGWTLAQNLFIAERNLLVEGPADLVYLKTISSILEASGKTRLRDDITVVPTGGLDKVVTFVALLGANDLKLAVLHDYNGAPDQKLLDLVRQKMISAKAVLNASQFRPGDNTSSIPTDLEDLLPVGLYLDCFNRAFEKQLGGGKLSEVDLPPGKRIIDRIDRHLGAIGLALRPSGGFNHYLPASAFAKNPPATLDPVTTACFESLFNLVNALF